MEILLKNTQVAVLSPPSIESTDIRIRNGLIVERGRSLSERRGEEVLNLRGKIVMPGFVCAHTHLYSSLARGMPPPKVKPQNFLEVLQHVWWKLDRALDEESIYYSALVGGIEAALCGTTTIIDHHSSPAAIADSLDVIKQALHEIGLRAILCYEVTDRGGKKERDQGLKENERFIRKNKKDVFFRGMVGAHASFTLSDRSLRLCGELASVHKTGVHIHAAEDTCDTADAEENFRCGVVDRLIENGIVNSKSILAHCVHLGISDFDKLRSSKCWLVHNPRSNMNNQVGYAPVHRFGDRVSMGTDGFSADMFEEARTGFFRNQESQPNGRSNMLAFLHGGQEITAGMFSQKFGTLAKGSVADLVVLDYRPPTPFTAKNLSGHFLFGMRSSMVESVMVGGKWVVKDHRIVAMDVSAAYEKARKAARKLWARM